MKIIRTLILPFALLLAVVSCKKDETEKTYMDGAFNISHKMPKFVSPGATYTFKVDGVVAPDGTEVGYCFTHPITKKIDTTNRYTFVIPDTLGTFALTCTAFPVESEDKYYASSATITYTAVSENGTLSRMILGPDNRTAKLYDRNYITAQKSCGEWLCYNLSYIKRDAADNEVFGHSYSDSPAMQNILGAYYTWEEAQTACPEGWRLPSDSDWVDLIKTCGGPDTLEPMQDSPSGAGNLMSAQTFNGVTMWEYYRGVKVTGNAFVGVIPSGYATIAGDKYNFTGFGSYAAFWTTDEIDGKGVYRYIYQEYDTVYVGLADKTTFAASVRCIR